MNPLYKNFHHVTPIQIRFQDIDAMNHLNNAVYLTYFELARIQYFQCLSQGNWDETNTGLIVAKAEVNYHVPVFFNDSVKVYVRCSRIGKKSFDLEYEMLKQSPSQEPLTAATGLTVLVAFNYQTQQSVIIPDIWKKRLLDFEQNPHLAA